MKALATTRSDSQYNPLRSRRTSSLSVLAIFVLCNLWYYSSSLSTNSSHRSVSIPLHAQETITKCERLHLKPGVSDDFYKRNISDRFLPGTSPVLIRNATIWTGRVNGLEILHGDILLDGGIIKRVGPIVSEELEDLDEFDVIDAHGAWVTPGIIDVHSHLGVIGSPGLDGSADGNSIKGPILPWLRSLDGLNTHDDGYTSSIAGGLTTALILPGSANAIGGQAFVIKLRPTPERSPTSMLLEPPFNLNYSYDGQQPLRWRHMKHACGENPARVYSGTRMDTQWAFRQAYDTARKLKNEQDDYCTKALVGDWEALANKQFPENLQWEALVDVLRGRVKVQTHCYEAVDIDDFVRLTNEFQFPVAAFHHAHEAWLVPDVLKRAYEHPPAVAMFAAFARYKREAYRHSEFAPRVLADNEIDVIMKSDHPAIVSRYLVHEAAQAHYYGLDESVALASVISTPAKVLGLDHRIGFIKPGYDADIVIWDSHPLALGATPVQVFIDGIAQLSKPHVVPKPASNQRVPETPDFDKEAADAVQFEGLPSLEPVRSRGGVVVFTNVSAIFSRSPDGETVVEAFSAKADSDQRLTVVVQEGKIVCQSLSELSACASYLPADEDDYAVVDLRNGALQPGLVTAGSSLGLQEIAFEMSTVDGAGYEPLLADPPPLTGGTHYVPLAVDGLQFGTRDALLAYRAGVTTAITAPAHLFFGGLSVAFSLAAAHKLEKGAVLQNVAAFHVALGHGMSPSVSTAIAALRRILLRSADDGADYWAQAVTEGRIPLVVEVNNADIIATLVLLKAEVEEQLGHQIRMTLLGGAEAHLIAHELAEANVGVLVLPPRPFPYVWDQRRILPGPPLSSENTIAHLVKAGVTVGLGPQGTNGEAALCTWAVRNLRWDAGWALLESPHVLDRALAFAMSSINVEKLLGVQADPYGNDVVVTSGGDLLSFQGKVVGVISSRRGKVDFFE